jgi:hypothetical protein
MRTDQPPRTRSTVRRGWGMPSTPGCILRPCRSTSGAEHLAARLVNHSLEVGLQAHEARPLPPKRVISYRRRIIDALWDERLYADHELDDPVADPALGRDSFTGRCPCCDGPILVDLLHDEPLARVPCPNGCQVVGAIGKRLADAASR